MNVLKRFQEPLFATPKLHFAALNMVSFMLQTQLTRVCSV